MKTYLRTDLTAGVNRYSYPVKAFLNPDLLSDENSLSLSYCRYGYNITLKNGSLTGGPGIDNAEINGKAVPDVIAGRKIMASWIYTKYDYTLQKKDHRLMVRLDDNRIYEYNLETGTSFVFTTMSVGPMDKISPVTGFFNNEDVLFLYLSTGGMYMYNGTTATYIDPTPWISSACPHYGRIYAVRSKENRVSFSSSVNPTDFNVGTHPTSAGYLTLTDDGGIVRKVVSFNDYLFIFRDNAIHRLTAYSDFTEYRLVKVYTTNSRIFADTICVCGGRIIFLADDGLYTFDGYDARRIYAAVMPLISDKRYAAACWFDHKYFLSAGLVRDGNVVGDEGAQLKNNGMLIFDFDLDSVSVFRGADIAGFTTVNSGDYGVLILNFNTVRNKLGMVSQSGSLFGSPLKKRWESPKSDLGSPSKDKVLRKLFLNTVYPLKIGVEGKEKTVFDIAPSMNIQLVPVNKSAETVKLSIETDEDVFYLSSLLIEFDSAKRMYR